jgi:transcriptional regulator with XRE-family HTH domain
MKAITLRLRQLRLARGRWSQEKLAYESGVSFWIYRKIEAGYRKPTADELQQLADALKAQPSEILAPVAAPEVRS